LVNFFKAFLKFFRISFITENRKKRTSWACTENRQ
jgi:hypothetical protein